MSHLRVPVEEFTTPNPVTAQEKSTIDELVQLMKKNEVRHLPIVRGKNVIGIISERDLKVASSLNKNEKLMVQASDIMVTNPITVSCETPLDEVAFTMSNKKIGSVIVNDENDEFLGIFTVTDALNALIEIARELESDLSL